MVKTRSQQKIAFPRRKAKSRSKSDFNSDRVSDKATSCCMSISCREKTRDVESFEQRLGVDTSPAKKKKVNSEASSRCSSRSYSYQSSDVEKENPLTQRTRRFLTYEENEDDQVLAVVARESRCKSDVVKGSTKPSCLKASSSLQIANHTPRKGHDDDDDEKLDTVFFSPSPLKCTSTQDCTSGKKLSFSRSTSSITQSEKRRRSSGSDKERESLPHRLLNKRMFNGKRPHSTNSTPLLTDGEKCPSRSGLENMIPNRQLLCVGTQDGHLYKEAKHVLHSSIPESLLCREAETKQIATFLRTHLVHKQPGSLYISGAPGTGKTACLTHILEKLQKNGLECQVQFINCMNISKSHRIYSKITEELTGWDKLTNKEAQRFLEKKFTTKGSPIVLVLDEIDQLESKNQDVLYTMFEWPSLPSSRLILIGIANALDLTDRVLPRLQLRTECKPKLLHFSPYSKDQIVKILTARLSEVGGSSVVDVSAVQFCARKIAAVSGDMRKALDICRRAVEVVETEVKRQQILKPIDTTASPKKAVVKKVTIAHVSRVISEVYGSRIVNSSGGEQPTIPLQQKLLICTILLMQKESKLREIPVGQLHETYCSICKKKQVSQISQEDCLALCNLLETRGIISMKRAKETRMAKVSLKIDEKEVDHALQDKILLSSILQGGLK